MVRHPVAGIFPARECINSQGVDALLVWGAGGGMGTVQAINQIKASTRRMVASLYAHTPGFLSHLKGKVVILTYHRVVTDHEIATQSIQPAIPQGTRQFAPEAELSNTQ